MNDTGRPTCDGDVHNWSNATSLHHAGSRHWRSHGSFYRRYNTSRIEPEDLVWKLDQYRFFVRIFIVQPKKSWLIVKQEHLNKAMEIFQGTDHKGDTWEQCMIGDVNFKTEYCQKHWSRRWQFYRKKPEHSHNLLMRASWVAINISWRISWEPFRG